MTTPDPSTLIWHVYASEERKRKFAALARVRPDTPEGLYEAACLTFPEEEYDNLARLAITQYPHDRVVIEEMARLAKQEPENDLPTRAQQARDIYNLAMGAKSVDDRLKAHKLYAEVMGFTQKPAAGSTVNTLVDNRRVYVMPRPMSSLDEFAKLAGAHQAKLLANAQQDNDDEDIDDGYGPVVNASIA